MKYKLTKNLFAKWILAVIVVLFSATGSYANFTGFLKCGFSPKIFERWALAQGFQLEHKNCTKHDAVCIHGTKSSDAGKVRVAVHAIYARLNGSDIQIEVTRAYLIATSDLSLLIKYTDEMSNSIAVLGMPDSTNEVDGTRILAWKKNDVKFTLKPHNSGIGGSGLFSAELAIIPKCTLNPTED